MMLVCMYIHTIIYGHTYKHTCTYIHTCIYIHAHTHTHIYIYIHADLAATPRYNSALLLEMGSRERHINDLYICILNCPAITDAILLCKVWLKQRGWVKVMFSIYCMNIIIFVTIYSLMEILMDFIVEC